MAQKTLTPDYVFEVSWEICNKVGGINTVIATKSLILTQHLKDKLILIGPDIWRDTDQNPAFKEDPNLFKAWKRAALRQGLRVRIGRWDIIGEPIAILVDFSAHIAQKDTIFKEFWESYRLDSLSGDHDYIESAMFGYVAGMTIDSFWRYHLSVHDKVVAHFHEWMTGAGILYLNSKLPQVSTLFTTHATVVGRSIAGNGMPLYDRLHHYNGDQVAHDLGVVAKHSMEKCAAQTSDCFTTVSDITASECIQLLSRKIDVVTPNGFEDGFVPKGDAFDETRKIAHDKLIEVGEAILGHKLSKDVLLVANSGRYEFRNKGIDVFIEALGQLNSSPELNKEILAFIMVPANNYGPRRDLQEKLNTKSDVQLHENYLSHNLHDSDYDQILSAIRATNLPNKEGNKVKIIFVPSYLNGNDGIFNIKYYDLLIGFDLTVFPSYYEPWGYTPLESLAFHIPTVTTNLAGIGMWVNSEDLKGQDGISVFERHVGIDQVLIDKIKARVIEFASYNTAQTKKARKDALSVSKIALWENLVKFYFKAYEVALSKIELRKDRISEIKSTQVVLEREIKSSKPSWRNIVVEAQLPEMFQGLEELSHNLWWCWNYDAIELFEAIDPKLWAANQRNPILLLKVVPVERFNELGEDESFVKKYNDVLAKFHKYMAEKSNPKLTKVAYFSMEFGLSDTVRIFSGGLGILAGDYLKEASDYNYPMVGVGFLYRFGYFTQQLSPRGEQMATYDPQDQSSLPITLMKDSNGEMIVVQVAFPGRVVYARVWRVNVGRIPLYLLDTDFEMNNHDDRRISHQLYGGDHEHRLKQEMFLGIGGTRALDKMGIEMDMYHCNEGHAALLGVERIRKYIVEKNLTFDESLEIVRASTLFTTHTPVPAGHDVFAKELIMIYMGHYPERLKTTWERFIGLGRMNPNDDNEKFSMSVLAANVSQEMNGVSWLHGEVTKDMFVNMYEGYTTEESQIGFVTNGVHLPTWTAKPWRELYEKEFGKAFLKDQSNKEHWKPIYNVPDKTIWDIRQGLRKKLINHIKTRLNSNLVSRQIDPKKVVKVTNMLNDNILTIGFARRFATYKRAYLLFKDLDRLAKLVNDPNRPVQFLFAGKAHPADGAGQDMIKHIVEISNMPQFLGKIVFVQNYDIELAKHLVQGVDIWLNTPTRPLEASGTSGMKAVMNGVLNFSVLDGWWVEGYKEGAGWQLPMEQTYENNDFQDELDAETLYTTIENDIAPLYYNKGEDGIPSGWVQYIKKNIAEIAPEFTTKRMLDDYISRFYNKLGARSKELKKNDFQLAQSISSWKKRVARGWDSIAVIDLILPDNHNHVLSGQVYSGEIILDLKEIADISVGIEMVITQNGSPIDTIELEMYKMEGTKANYKIEFTPPRPGSFSYSFRIFPKNPHLPHRQDFPYMTWI